MSKIKKTKPKFVPDMTKCKNGPGCTCWELMCPPCSKEISKLRKAHRHQYEMAGLMLRNLEEAEADVYRLQKWLKYIATRDNSRGARDFAEAALLGSAAPYMGEDDV